MFSRVCEVVWSHCFRTNYIITGVLSSVGTELLIPRELPINLKISKEWPIYRRVYVATCYGVGLGALSPVIVPAIFIDACFNGFNF